MGRYNPTSFNILTSKQPKKIDPKIEVKVKLVMIGESSVGKTSLVNRLVFDRFQLNTNSTVGSAFCALRKDYNDKKYKFHIWDTAGQERFRALVPMYVKNADIVLLVFDITDHNTYEKIKNLWYEYVNKLAPESIKILIGNKADLEDKRCVSQSEIKRYVNDLDIEYMECSAKQTINISNLINALLKNSEKIYSPPTNEIRYSFDDEDNNTIITLENGWEDEDSGCFDIKCNAR